jgi:hypothetical protein
MVLKPEYFGKQVTNRLKSLKCGSGGVDETSLSPTVRKIKKYYIALQKERRRRHPTSIKSEDSWIGHTLRKKCLQQYVI